MSRYKILFYISAILIALFSITGCSDDDNPVTPHEEHNEAEGLVLKVNGTTIVVVQEGQVKQGSISVKAGESTAAILVKFLDQDGDEFTPDEEDSALSIDITGTSIAEYSLVAGKEWEFTVTGKKTGSTGMNIKLMHGNHADFTAPPITVEVTS